MVAAAVDDLGGALREARRNVFLLSAAQAMLGVVGPICFSIGGVAGYQLLANDKSLATAPLTAFNVGMALGVVYQYDQKLRQYENAADRAYLGEHLNRQVTAVVMEARGVYSSDTTEEAKKFADGILKQLFRNLGQRQIFGE